MAKHTELQEALEAILQDGGWHGIRELYYKTRDLIKPEVAIRNCDNQKLKATGDLEAIIEDGTIKAIQKAARNQGVDIRGGNLSRQYRLNPGNRPSKTRVYPRGNMRERFGALASRTLATIPEIRVALEALKQDDLTPLQFYYVGLALSEPEKGDDDGDALDS